MPAADPNAHSKVQRALRSGKLVRPDQCDRCGAAEVKLSDGRSGLHAHHEDYSKPLDVQWLCVTCHLGVRQSDSRRIHVVMDPEMLRRIDAAVPAGTTRGEFVRAAVEQALGGCGSNGQLESPSPAPAEQPCEWCGHVEDEFDHKPCREALEWEEQPDTRARAMARSASATYGTRTSVQAKRDVRPVPKAKP